MDFTEVRAGPQDAGRRLDRVLRRYLKEESLSRIYGALRKGLIRRDGRKALPDDKLTEGSVLRIPDFLLKAPETEYNAGRNIHLEIIFQNPHVKIIYKPYGLAVQSGKDGEADVVRIIQSEHTPEQGQDSLSFVPAPLHRLDRRTSGLLICSQSIAGAHWTSDALRRHLIQKSYLALVQGTLGSGELWQDCITEKRHGGTGFRTVQAGADGKAAVTQAVPLAHGRHGGTDVTLARMDIATGRTHQIRAQAALHGHPLLGDTAYGGTEPHGRARKHYLHAYRLRFPAGNPLGIPQDINAGIPADFIEMLELCGIRPAAVLPRTGERP